jgi:S-adenosyl methyltransferase
MSVAEDSSGSTGAVPPGVDTSVANSARVWNYWLGGKDNYAVDREAGDHVLTALPIMGVLAREDRAFLGRAVRYLAGEEGIRQFLDIGTGIPTANNTHEVAQAVAPESRIVYVDNDPVVLAHARALLTSSPEGATNYIDADLRDTGKILAAAAETLDFAQPVAVALLAILGHIDDADDPHAVVARLMDAVPSGSYLVISHPIDTSAEMNEAARVWNERSPTKITPRPQAEIARFFDGLELLDPGVVQLPDWRPDSVADIGSRSTPVPHYCGVGRKA